MNTDHIQTLTTSIYQVQSYKTSMKWLLDDRQEEFWAIFDQSAIGIAQLRTDGRWLLGNAKLCNLLGYSREELLNRNLLDSLHPDDLEISLNYIASMLECDSTIPNSKNSGLELRLMKKTGDFLWVHFTLCLVQNAIGAPNSFMAIVQDISDRKYLKQLVDQQFTMMPEQPPLEPSVSQSQELSSLKTFADGITHELNNTLTPILSIAQLLQLKSFNGDEQTQQLLRLLEDSAKRAATFVKQISILAQSYRE